MRRKYFLVLRAACRNRRRERSSCMRVDVQGIGDMKKSDGEVELLWIDKARAQDKTYIWVSVWWKNPVSPHGVLLPSQIESRKHPRQDCSTVCWFKYWCPWYDFSVEIVLPWKDIQFNATCIGTMSMGLHVGVYQGDRYQVPRTHRGQILDLVFLLPPCQGGLHWVFSQQRVHVKTSGSNAHFFVGMCRSQWKTPQRPARPCWDLSPHYILLFQVHGGTESCDGCRKN